MIFLILHNLGPESLGKINLTFILIKLLMKLFWFKNLKLKLWGLVYRLNSKILKIYSNLFQFLQTCKLIL